jgi:hypothetical protein
MKRIVFALILVMCCLFMAGQPAQATEGASSYYFPGAASTFAAAVAPNPGFMVYDQMLFYKARVDEAVFRGRAHLEVKADAFYDYIGGFYTFEKPLLGGRFQIGAAVPIGYVHLKAGIDTALGSLGASDSNASLGDSLITPALYWNAGDFHFKLAETVYLPTGGYNKDNLANVGRNYWGFDTSFAMTWLNMKTGTEISVVPGILLNTENTKTDYRSGSEFHVDFMVNQFLAKTFAVGLQGYYYGQVSGDSGKGAKLGGFRGESLGLGPALLWMPDFGKGKLSLVAKLLHDVVDGKRLKGDYGQVIVSYRF